MNASGHCGKTAILDVIITAVDETGSEITPQVIPHTRLSSVFLTLLRENYREMKEEVMIYIVTYDDHDTPYECEIILYGAFDSLNKIPKEIREDGRYQINEVRLNLPDNQIYLGGYVE